MNTFTRFAAISLMPCSVTVLCPAQDSWIAPFPNEEWQGSVDGRLSFAGIDPAQSGDSTPGWINPDDVEMSSRGGPRIFVYLRDATMMYGDLLTVDDSTLSLYVYKDLSLVYVHDFNSGAHEIDFRVIDRLVVKGRSRMLQGIFIGFLGGMVTGSVVGKVAKRQSAFADMTGPGGLGGIGLILGGTVGCLTSGSDIEFRNFGASELRLLRPLCGPPRTKSP